MMMQAIIVEQTISEDGSMRLVLNIPSVAADGRVNVIITPKQSYDPPDEMTEAEIETEFEKALELMKKYPRGQGLTMGEILKSPEIGMWKDRQDMDDSVEYVARMRRTSNERRMHRD
ncbi:MAG: hypothetical protein SGI73_06495 [Chloroflexota bacterium]|nr:hypothetical protein [Chloroflexota bacterium]